MSSVSSQSGNLAKVGPAFLKINFALVLCVSVFAQTPATKEPAKQDFSKEGAVIEQMTTKVVFQSDGTYMRERHVRVRVQSDAGVQQYGILAFPYEASVEPVEILDVRVVKPNGSAIATPLDSIQDVTSEILRDAPLYSDSREKHVPVKGLEPGDTLEYSVRWRLEKPRAAGQFWFSDRFVKDQVVLDQQLVIDVPREREVKVKSQTVQPTTREENGRRIYLWRTSNLESQSVQKQKKAQSYDAIRGLLPPPDVLVSSFRNWEEVGRWYEGLQKEKIQPSPEINAEAEELTKDLADADAKLHAIYDYVSLRYRYVGVDFGIGRYQPHSAAEILGNHYGDCKDKHTLLAALLSAIGIRAYPVLINTKVAVDQDVPTPAQFNHVITVVEEKGGLFWMDSTPEVTRMGELLYPLRGKPALVIAPEKVAFQTTPVDPAVANKRTSTLTAKIDADGTLHAHMAHADSGDTALYLRYAFRRVPESQRKDLTQKISYGASLGGTITNVRISSPEKTDEPFTLAYDYTLRNFSEGDKHRFVVPLPPLLIPKVTDEDLKQTTPLWIGDPGESQLESRIELPKGWSATTPAPIDLKESFAEFQGSSELRDGVLITKRRFLLKASAVTPDQLAKYEAFEKAASEDHQTYIFLSQRNDTVPPMTTVAPLQVPSTSVSSSASSSDATPIDAAAAQGHLIFKVQPTYPNKARRDRIEGSVVLSAVIAKEGNVKDLTLISGHPLLVDAAMDAVKQWRYEPYKLKGQPVDVRTVITVNFTLSGNGADTAPPDAARLTDDAYSAAAASCRDNGFAACLDDLKKFTALNPTHPLAWNELGLAYLSLENYEEAEKSFRTQIEVNPATKLAYNDLGRVFLREKKYDEALANFQKQLEINPEDMYAHGNMGLVYEARQDYDKARTELEKGVGLNPKYAVLRVALANAYAHFGQLEKSRTTLEEARAVASTPANWNTVAYEMSLRNLSLDLAQKYADSAVTATEAATRTASLDHVTKDDLRREESLASYWDTLGWVHFQETEFDAAEKYIHAAWLLRQTGVIADHLGQVYEKMGRKEDAASFYAQALVVERPDSESKNRWIALTTGNPDFDKATLQARDQLASLDTFNVACGSQKDVQAAFYLAFGPGPTLEDVKYLGYDEDLKPLSVALREVKWQILFPDSTPTTVIRRIAVHCEAASTSGKGTILPLSEAIALEAGPPAVPGTNGIYRVGNGVSAPKALYAPAPRYAEKERKEKRQGTVVLSLVVTPEGEARDIKVTQSLTPNLDENAIDAVRQWRFQPGMKDGKPVAVQINVQVSFKLY